MSVMAPEKSRPKRRKPAVNPWPAALRTLVKASGKTQEEFARDVLGVSIRTFRGWLYGERPIPHVVGKLIDCLKTNPPK